MVPDNITGDGSLRRRALMSQERYTFLFSFLFFRVLFGWMVFFERETKCQIPVFFVLPRAPAFLASTLCVYEGIGKTCCNGYNGLDEYFLERTAGRKVWAHFFVCFYFC